MSRQRDQVVSVEILADFEAFTFRLARELAHTTPYPMSEWAAAITRVSAICRDEAVTRERIERLLAVEGINGPAMFVRAMEAMEWPPKPLGLHVSREQATRALTSSMTRRDATSRNTARGRAK